jgi:hypothetical protein
MSLLRELQCNVLNSSNVETTGSISAATVALSNGGLTLNNPGPADAPEFSSQLFANMDVNNKGELVVSGDNIVHVSSYYVPGVPATTSVPALVVNVVSGGSTGKYYLPLWSLD